MELRRERPRRHKAPTLCDREGKPFDGSLLLLSIALYYSLDLYSYEKCSVVSFYVRRWETLAVNQRRMACLRL